MTKMSDLQQEILQTITNSNNNLHLSDQNTWNDEMDHYFVSSWPIQNHEELSILENKLQSDPAFKNKVVIHNILS